MIVISSALVASASYAAEAWRPIIGWNNLVTVTTIAATSEDTDYPATNLANASTAPGQRWESLVTTVQYLTVTYNSSDEIDYVAVFGHNWGSTETSVTIETLDADEGAVWTVEVAEQLLPGDDGPAIFQFTPRFGAAVRIKLDPTGATTPTAPKASVVHVGKLINLPRGIPPGHTPINYGGAKRTVDNQAEDGGYLGSVVLGESLSTTLDLRDIDPAWYRTYLEPFRKAGKGTTFFFAWSPLSYPAEVGYCWLTNDPRPTINQKTGEIDISFQLSAVAI